MQRVFGAINPFFNSTISTVKIIFRFTDINYGGGCYEKYSIYENKKEKEMIRWPLFQHDC